MPRDVGTGIYHYPDGTPGNPGQTVFSTRYNTFINDLSNTLNQALPINMGGTGATNATAARANLKTEVASQLVTNFDTHVWENGSWHCGAGATGSPNAANPFAGVCIIHGNPQYITVEARDLFSPPFPAQGERYTRQMRGGTWGPWTKDGDIYVNTSGDTMTGDLTITKSDPRIVLNKSTGAGQQSQILSLANDLPRWKLVLGDGVEDFNVERYNDLGTLVGNSFTIKRSNGRVYVENATPIDAGEVATKSYVDTRDALSWNNTNSPRGDVGGYSYQRFLNGSMVQFGLNANGLSAPFSITFPVVFPTACRAVVAGISGSIATNVLAAVAVEGPSTSGFTVHARYQTGGTTGVASQPVYWIAWGY